MKIAAKLSVGLGLLIAMLLFVSIVAYNSFSSISVSASHISKYNIEALINAEQEATAAMETLAAQKIF